MLMAARQLAFAVCVWVCVRACVLGGGGGGESLLGHFKLQNNRLFWEPGRVAA